MASLPIGGVKTEIRHWSYGAKAGALPKRMGLRRGKFRMCWSEKPEWERPLREMLCSSSHHTSRNEPSGVFGLKLNGVWCPGWLLWHCVFPWVYRSKLFYASCSCAWCFNHIFLFQLLHMLFCSPKLLLQDPWKVGFLLSFMSQDQICSFQGPYLPSTMRILIHQPLACSLMLLFL